MINEDFCINSSKAILSTNNKNQFYFLPHPMLRGYIAHYTLTYTKAAKDLNTISSNKLDEELVIIPDGSGCMLYIINDSGFYDVCWGPTSKPVKVKKDNLLVNERMFFIEFLPGALYMFSGIPQKEVRDLQCSIKDINKNLNALLENAVKTSKSIDELVRRVDLILLNQIENSARNNQSVFYLVNKIKSSNDVKSVKSLAESVYFSERHLNRLFEKNIGINVKLFQKIARINKAIKIYKSDIKRSSSDIANLTGYFDQSHFIHEVNEFCGTTPSNFIKKMSDFYNEPFKY